MMDKRIITRNFSRSALSYNTYATIQKVVASHLIDIIPPNDFGTIVDIGCGTGNFTKLLAEKFPQAYIQAFDISEAMINFARDNIKDCNINFFVADAETVSFNKPVDLISSNGTLHWMGSQLGDVILRHKMFLSKSGMIAFSLFGQGTFYELQMSLSAINNRDQTIDATYLPTKDDVHRLISEHFQNGKIERRVYQEEYNSLRDFFKTMKYCGIRGHGGNKVFLWTNQRLDKLEKIYREKFGSIRVSYEVFLCGGRYL